MYQRKGYWFTPEQRMAIVHELETTGMSVVQIMEKYGIKGHTTVCGDLMLRSRRSYRLYRFRGAQYSLPRKAGVQARDSSAWTEEPLRVFGEEE